MHHIKLEKNWSRGYQEEVKKISNINRHYISCLAPPWGQNLYPKDNEIHNFGRGLPALHHHAFSFSYIHVHVVSEKKIFQKLVNFDTFCPAPKAPGGKET
jgi:hypothetical protein